MTKQELETRLSQAVNHTAPDNFDDVILRSEARKQKENSAGNSGNAFHGNFIIPKQKKKRSFAVLSGLVAACLVLALAGGGFSYYHYQADMVASVISLDVNPSIELTINKNDRVLSCTPLNADAASVLFDMDGGADLEGTKVDVAVNAIVGALVRHGYLDSVSSAILISVEDKDPERAEMLQAQLSDITQSILQAQESGADVISQTLAMDSGLEQQAHQNNISSGKAALINQIITLNDSLTFDGLAALSVDELQDLLETGAPAMPIGKDAAGYIAETYAGTLALDSVRAEVDAELDETPAHYEVELHTAFGEYEYLIDAYTGEVLRGRSDLLMWVQNTPSGMSPDQDSNQMIPPASETTPDENIPPTSGQTPETPSVSQPNVGEGYIGEAAAKTAALNHAGFSESDLIYCNCWLDYDDGHPDCYKVEFATDSTRYEYEIGLYHHSVLGCKAEHHRNSRHSSHHNGSCNVGTSTGTNTGTDIGEEAAKNAALTHAGLTESQVTKLKVERDYDDGYLEYEVEFECGQTEYEYTIDGCTGAILDYEWDS